MAPVKNSPAGFDPSRRAFGTLLAGGFAAASVLGAIPSRVLAQAARPAEDGRALNIVNFDIVEAEAKAILTPGAYAFIAGGAGDEWTLKENRRAFNDYPLLPHRLTGTEKTVDTKLSLLGHRLDFPIMVAPMGGHLMAHREAEVATAKGASGAGALYQSSGASNRPLEAIAAATAAPTWFQLYFNADLAVTRSLLHRARDAGYSAIILTADALGPGASDEFVRLGRPFPPGFTFGNHDPASGGSGKFLDQKLDLTFDDIDFIKRESGLPVVVKGLLRGADADAAVKAGAAAIQVSNHGGRQLDGVPPAISVLREVAQAVNGRAPVLFDSGIRRGIDVFRAIALGATAVAIGRPILYALAIGGAAGVTSVLNHIREELQLAMLLCGTPSLAHIAQEYVSLDRSPNRNDL